MQINGLELVISKSTQGNTSLTLQFALDKSIDAAATDVQTAISQATGSLPVDLPSPPTYSKTNPNDQPIMYIALTSDTLTDGDLYKYATSQVQQRINILPGVSQVQIFGVKSAIRVKVDPGALASRNIGTSVGIVADGDLHPYSRLNRYERAIERAGGIDVQILGIGSDLCSIERIERSTAPKLVATYSPSRLPHEFFLWDDPSVPGRALLHPRLAVHPLARPRRLERLSGRST
jgi:hypothetical protein